MSSLQNQGLHRQFKIDALRQFKQSGENDVCADRVIGQAVCSQARVGARDHLFGSRCRNRNAHASRAEAQRLGHSIQIVPISSGSRIRAGIFHRSQEALLPEVDLLERPLPRFRW